MKDSLLFIDDLTGVFNRRYLSEVKSELIPEFVKSGTEFSLVVVDIDHFKSVNDVNGHLIGDEVLAHFASYLKEKLRKEDIIIRYGGDEFLVIQPNLSSQDAFLVWNNLVEQVKKERFGSISISISVGLAGFPSDGDNFELLFVKADDRLYLAKRSGRGRVGTEEVKKVRIPPLDFVNRRKEWTDLSACVENGEIAIVKGDAGIGKTRLIREVLRTFKDVEVLWSDCVAIDNKIPYYPLRELIKYRVSREGFEILDDMPLPFKIEIGKIIPEVEKNISEEDIKKLGEDLDKYRLYEAFNYVFNLGEKKKVIVIDNIQWIDKESIDALKYIMLGNRGRTVFVLAQRSEENVPYVDRFINGLQRTYPVRRINLQPFDERYVKELVKAIVGESVESLENYVWPRSAGNPFYVEELVKTLNREGFLKTDGTKWLFTEPEEELLPGGIEGIIREKYNGLSHDARELLKLLSVAGKGYIGLLSDILGFKEGYIFGLVEEGIRSTLIRENTVEDFVEFRYGMARDVIYNTELNSITRTHLHRKVAKWLESNKRDGNEEEIAYHYRMGKVKEKVIEYGEKAGDRAQRLYADENALNYYGWAEEELREKSAESPSFLKKYVDILIKKAAVLRKIGNFGEAEEFLKKALEIAKSRGLVEIEKFAGTLLRNVLWNMGKLENALSVLISSENAEATVDKMEKQGAVGEKHESMLKKKFGRFGKVIKRYDKVRNLTDKVKNKIEETGIKDSKIAREALGYISKAKNVMESYTDRVAPLKDTETKGVSGRNYVDTREVATSLGYRLGQDLTLDNIAVLFATSGDFDSAERYLNQALSDESVKQDQKRLSYIYNNLGMVYKSKGDLKKSLKFLLEAEKMAEKIVDRVGEVLYKNNIAGLLIDIGSISTAENLLKESYDLSLKIGESSLIAETVKNIVRLYVAKAENQKALLVLNKQELEEKVLDRRDLLLLKANVLLLSGQYEHVYDVLVELEEYFSGKAPMPLKIEYEFLNLGYHIGTNDEDGAVRTLDNLYYLLKRYPDKLYKAMYYQYGGMLYCKKNRVKALKHFEKAMEIYKSMGLKRRAEVVLMEEKRCYGIES